MTTSSVQVRRMDLDWLRVIAFGLLIFFHAAIIFVQGGLPLIQSATTSLELAWFVAFLQEFRLGLLFLVSGAGTAFALRQRDRAEFFAERSRRLLIPAVFGILIIVPPMVWVEKLHIGQFAGSFWTFYGELFTHGVYPSGHLSWHHYWFVVYLALFCVIGWPLLTYLRSERGHAWVDHRVVRRLTAPRIYGFALVLLLFELLLRPLFPGFRDLIHDWASFVHWFCVFIVGFILVKHESVLARVQSLRGISLATGIVTSGLMFYFYLADGGHSFHPFPHGDVSIEGFVVFSAIRMLNAWVWLLVCLGYASRYLRRSNSTLEYLNGAVYPLFCVHLTLIVWIGSWIVEKGLGVWSSYLVVCVLTVIGSLLCYEVIRRVGWLRVCFGLKPVG